MMELGNMKCHKVTEKYFSKKIIMRDNSKKERLKDKEDMYFIQVNTFKGMLKIIEHKEREIIMVDKFNIVDNGKILSLLLEAINSKRQILLF